MNQLHWQNIRTSDPGSGPLLPMSPYRQLRQLTWVHDWHIREETYAAALSRLICRERRAGDLRFPVHAVIIL